MMGAPRRRSINLAKSRQIGPPLTLYNVLSIEDFYARDNGQAIAYRLHRSPA
jgi:hypothetical protein